MNGDDMGIRVGSSERNVDVDGRDGFRNFVAAFTATMYMQHWNKNDWLLMFHYNVFVDVNHQGGPRGVTKFESANWFMPMAYHKLGTERCNCARCSALSHSLFRQADRPAVSNRRDLQRSAADRSSAPARSVHGVVGAVHTSARRACTWFTYFGYPGEPALGRSPSCIAQSASENSVGDARASLAGFDAHQLWRADDGFTYRWFKLEGSIFNGREPDENRYDFDAHKWNSAFSAAVVYAQSKLGDASQSRFLRSPENQEPEVDVRRTTASLQYNRKFESRQLGLVIYLGTESRQRPRRRIINLNSYTAESTVQFLDKNYLYTRLSWLTKTICCGLLIARCLALRSIIRCFASARTHWRRARRLEHEQSFARHRW
jgi:hypothetical protein